MEFQARLYEKDSTAHEDITVEVAGDGRFANESLRPFHFREVEVSQRVGNIARYLRLPDGRSLETRDNDAIDQLCDQWHEPNHGLLHRLESNIKLALVAVVVTLLGGYLFVIYGIPALSRPIVHMMPAGLDTKLAESALEQLDREIFDPTQLPEPRRERLQELFNDLVPAGSDHQYRLLFRNSERIGANAFALPDGTIVFTDQLINLTEDDQLIAPIMLHEIGHVEERHAMQSLVQQASLSAVIVLISGDVNTASSLVIMLPSILIQAGYSQQKEWEADTYALEQMQSRDMDPRRFAQMMERMMASHKPDELKNAKKSDKKSKQEQRDQSTADSDGEQAEEDEKSLWDYFSTHPPTDERIARFREAAEASAD